MGKPHGQGRHAALRLAVAGLRTVQLSILLAGVLLLCSPIAWALDPALDVSQYAHTAWKVRDGFAKGAIYAIAQTPDGYLWLGTEFGLFRFDGVRSVQWEPPTGEHLPRGRIRSLLAGRDGTIWIGTGEGLANWKDGKLTRYPELADIVVVTLFEDHEGTVWVGGYAIPTGRLCAIQGSSVKCFGEDGSLGHGAGPLYEDSRGNLWVGAQTGLWRWKPGPPKLYPVPDSASGIQGLVEDDNGALLIATPSEIRRLVDGKAEAYPLEGIGRQFKLGSLFRDRH